MARIRSPIVFMAIVAALTLTLAAPGAFADPVAGGTLDPTTIPKYVIPLVIPPVMNNNGANDEYEIAVREFKQQILPGGIWNALNGRTDDFPATTVWSYGPADDPLPDASPLGLPAGVAPAPNSQFNYPSYTIEARADHRVDVRWINDLKSDFGAGSVCLPHLLPIDQTLHWANPPGPIDAHGTDPTRYDGPVPIITHVHGAHVRPESDGYPEAWWLPADCTIPDGYATKGTLFNDATGTNPGNLGYADFSYPNDQPAATLWYHDHTLGMTRSNVYAGPAGFWLVRGGEFDKTDNVWTRWWKWDGILPGPAPKAGDTVLELNAPGVMGAKDVRSHIREIPIAIQGRSFNTDGSLFYPDNRAFFEGLNVPGEDPQFPGEGELQIDFVPNSDIAPIWNPEAFFNVTVVNGVSWPTLDVAPALYRFRLLNGTNARFLNLSMKIVSSPLQGLVGKELSFYQIGAEQGFLPKVVEIRTGFATPLPGDGRRPRSSDRIPASNPSQALLMGNAERADVLVDFRFLPNGTVIQMNNTGPDSPFGGFPVALADLADSNTTGQVMQFVVKWNLFKGRDLITTPPWALKLKAEPALGGPIATRTLSLNEGESEVICAEFVGDDLVQVVGSTPPACAGGGEPFAPKEALLGIVNSSGNPVSMKWSDPITEEPKVNTIEQWDIYNFTVDAHPIHLHLVRFEVVNREKLEVDAEGAAVQPFAFLDPREIRNPAPPEMGYKDTVIALPGEVTRVKALFDIEGLYVWHCHIVEHEDNEMMRPFRVVAQ